MVAPTTLNLTPTDDVWVYPHASDPGKDEYLRVWGVGGKAVAEDSGDADNFSYAYLKWDVSTFPKDAKLTEAKLIVTHIASPTFDLESAKKSPLEARPILATFEEKKWTYEESLKNPPDKKDKSYFGTGFPDLIPADKVFTISIDLLKGPNDFKKYLADNPSSLALAVVSTLDPSESENRRTYKLYSKDTEKPERRPVLKLVYEKSASQLLGR